MPKTALKFKCYALRIFVPKTNDNIEASESTINQILLSALPLVFYIIDIFDNNFSFLHQCIRVFNQILGYVIRV